jgi:eukaryotic translation initiation factor 2C
MIILLSSVRPAPQKMILTIDTCMAAVYVFNFFPAYLLLTFTRYRAGDLCNVALMFLGETDISVLKMPSSDLRFKQLEKFLNNVRISIRSSSGKRTKTIRGLVGRAGKFVFSKNDDQEITVAVSFYPSLIVVYNC